MRNEIICNDVLWALRDLEDSSVDLIVTSPPYSDQRAYSGVPADRYVEWFKPIALELFRVLKPQGTFILNIKEKVSKGERSTYVLELILEMRRLGWLWTEEFIWHKRNCYPGKWPNRFRDAWERVLQFNKAKKFAMYQEAVMVPVGNWAKTRLKDLCYQNRERVLSSSGSGLERNYAAWVGRDKVYPSNVLHFSVETKNRAHSAVFPKALPEWFIKLFSKEGDLVLDPFIGSGTTAVVAKRLGRDFLGIDNQPEYCALALENVRTA